MTEKSFDQKVIKTLDKLDILNYYPYGHETTWNYWLCGKVNLKKQYLDKRNLERNENDIVIRILSEVSRAMHYLTVLSPDFSEEQRVKAYQLSILFQSGICGWNKNLIKNKTEDEIIALEKFHKKRHDKIHKSDMKLYSETHDIVTYRITKEAKEYNRKKYGVYEVKYFPLMEKTSYIKSTPKCLYTKQQLCAIEIMVDCAFENLC